VEELGERRGGEVEILVAFNGGNYLLACDKVPPSAPPPRERSRAINTGAFAASWKIYGAIPVRIYPRAFIIKARRRCARRRVD